MFKNKHIIVALIVAPILAILSYLGVDRMVSEKPHAAKEDVSYPLAAKSGCRYASGECLLVNGDVKITLTAGATSGEVLDILLHASLPIDGAKVALTTSDYEGEPVSFEPADKQMLDWMTTTSRSAIEDKKLRLVVSRDEILFYAEVDTVFLHAENSVMER